jgi:hypothetical protein
MSKSNFTAIFSTGEILSTINGMTFKHFKQCVQYHLNDTGEIAHIYPGIYPAYDTTKLLKICKFVR